jgi:hypothetical protein
MDIKEFIDQGYLQEVNRQFLHPLGLALVASAQVEDDTGEVTDQWEIRGVWDARDDPEGIIFSEEVLDSEKASRVAKEQAKRLAPRLDALGYIVQSV